MEEVSIRQMLQMALDEILDIDIPVRLADQISRPLCGAAAKIEAVINAIPEEKEGDEQNGV